jgi:trk system potassium uptake protein TrkA
VRIVIAGGGAVGRHLAADLLERNHDITLIEQEPRVAGKIENTAEGVEVVLGDACELWVLERARITEADVVVAATGDDEDNLVISLLSKQEFGVPRVLARVNHPKNEWMFTDQWGVDDAVSPPHILTALVEEAVSVGDLVRLLRLQRGQVALVETKLPADSPNANHPLYELRLPPDSAIVAILREGHVVIPVPETVLAPDDEILALASPEAETAFVDAVVGGMPATAPDHSHDGQGDDHDHGDHATAAPAPAPAPAPDEG